MKKSLIALAALAATASFAQSSVTLDGYFDRGYLATNNTNDAKDTKTVGSLAGTTTVGIKVREDLGGGMSAGAWISTDWSDIGGASQTSAVANAQTSGFANSQSFIDLTGSFGTVRFGTPNNFTLTNATAVAAPAFSTGVGSTYSTQFSIANGLSTGQTGLGGTVQAVTNSATTGSAGARAIRINNSIQYSTPVFSGFSAHLGYTPKNNNVVGGVGNTVGVQEVALRYTNGPVDAMLSSIKYTVGNNGTSQTQIASGALTQATLAAQDNTQNLLGVTYAVLPNLKLHGGYGTFSSTADTYKGSSTQIGATYTMGAWDLMGQYAKLDDKSTTNSDRKMIGLGVNYNLSKTARIYARYDNINWADNKAEVAGSKQNRFGLGVSKFF